MNHKPKHNPYIGFTIPDDLSLEEHEKPSLSQVIYKGKVVTEWRKKSTLQNLYFVYLLIKMNGGLNKKGCSLPIHAFTRLPNPFTGKIIGVDTASGLLTGLLEAGIITSNNHWDKEAKISKIYKVTDKIKTYARMSLYYTSKKESNQIKPEPLKDIMKADQKEIDMPDPYRDLTQDELDELFGPEIKHSIRTTSTTAEEDPYSDLTEDELEELFGNYVVREPVREPKLFTDKQIRTIEAIRHKHRTPFHCDRYRSINIDPHETRVCMTCNHERPVYMFSLSENGSLNDQCRGCYEVGDTDAEEMVDYLTKWINRETPTQRSIRKLKAQMAELAA